MVTPVQSATAMHAEAPSGLLIICAKLLPYVFVIALISLGAGLFAQAQLPIRYTARSTLVPGAPTDDSLTDDEAAEHAGSDGFAGEMQLIRSRELARRVAGAFGLAARPEYSEPTDSVSRLTRLLSTLGLARAPSEATLEERTLAAFAENLTVAPIAGGAAVEIGFTSTDPTLAASVADAVAAEVVALQRTAVDRATAADIRRLASEAVDTGDALIAAEAAVAAFRAEHDLSATASDTGAAAKARVADIRRQLARAQAEFGAVKVEAVRLRAAASARDGAIPADRTLITTPVMQWLSGEQTDLRRAIAAASTAFRADDPRLVALERRLAGVNARITGEIARRAAAVEAEAEALEGIVTRLTASLDEAEAEVVDHEETATALRVLEDKALMAGRLMTEAERRYRDAVTRRDAAMAHTSRLAIAATVPTVPVARPLEPSTAIMLALSGITLAVACLAWARSRRRRSGLPPIVQGVPMIPDPVPIEARFRWADDRGILRMMPRDPTLAPWMAARSERSLAAVAERIANGGHGRILVTLAGSAGNAHRRPPAAVALARTLAWADRRVVVVDLWRDEGVGTSDPIALGIDDLLEDRASFAQVIRRDHASRAHFIPAGRAVAGVGPETTGRMAALVSTLDHTYDHVIIDVPDELVDVLGPSAEVAVVVSEHAAADPRTLRVIRRMSAAAPAPILLLSIDPVLPDAAAEMPAFEAAEAAA